ncbi:MAG: 3-oxoacyl-[acyl-carrier-protein] reductase [Lentisphaerae bacterium RIFOXYB12_FULL_65_16]|nr:MAG: 3-oxoacyl-[acyl-carrier-protein] reductase [Lentisphaerae bacterium RIFOXYA12_64_32]OGV85395.1 MAG: 3-oxoacyl-[acyl-carrier-protein] reductase [Lentisphaerae bacterium RIFOXYB12_FULL_65_16]
MELAKQVALVTGGARGIGKAICKELAAAGARLAVVDIMKDVAEQTATEFLQQGVDAKAFAANVADGADVERMVDEVLAAMGQVDILVNNAGITRDNLIVRMKDSDWDAVIAVNLKGTFNCTKAVARPMMKARRGKIVNIASIVGVMGNAGQANYSASKAGVIGLTKSAAKELASRNILVNAVAPGYIQTEMTEKLSDQARQNFLSVIPLARPGTPEDVARVVRFLAGPASDYVTGQVIHIDGGMVM